MKYHCTSFKDMSISIWNIITIFEGCIIKNALIISKTKYVLQVSIQYRLNAFYMYIYYIIKVQIRKKLINE